VEAFLPASQIDVITPKNLAQYVGNTYDFKVVKINQERQNIVLSRRELIEALQPFLYPVRDDPVVSADGRREQFGNILTIIKNARFNDVATECAANRYTHIHILAHGDKDPEAEDTSYALVLHTAENEPDVISGERFASAFTCLVGDAIQRPAVVSLASCDSGNDGSVIIPGGSIAHVLHQAGIPLVVASQFPLSKEGSTLVVREFYRGLLWGESPWILLHRIRTSLHGRLTAHSHDWASLVVYEALPANLDEQLEVARYSQGKLAIDAALERIDRAVLDSGAALDAMLFKQLTQAVVDAGRKLPMGDRFAMECLGLLGSSQKRLALAEFNIALAAAAPDARAQHVLESCARLDQALHHYEQAAAGFLINQGQAVQRMSSLHWVLVQQLCLAAVLGKPVREGTWETARLSAESYLDLQEVEERAWAHGSLAELWLLRLTDPMLRPNLADRSRFRLPRYAMQIKRGLILVDMSVVAPEAPPAGPVELGAIPDDLGDRAVTRQHYKTDCNWKRLRQFLWQSPELAFGGADCDAVVEVGPLSLVALRNGDAALLRVVPRFPAQTDVELVEMPVPGGSRRSNGGGDSIGDALREQAGGIAAARLDRAFYEWYWPLMAPAPAAVAS
jgi:hypothetical protein